MNSDIQLLTERLNAAPEITVEVVDAMNGLALLYMDTDPAAAADMSASAIAHAHALGYQQGEATALLNAGLCASRRRDYTEALVLYQRSLDIKTALNDEAGIASVHTKIGNAKLRAGDYASALNHYSTAIEILKDSDDRLAVADLYANSGIIHGFQGNYSLALRSHLQALSTYEPLNELSRMASSYSNIGFVYTDQQNFDEALKMFQRALDIRQNTDDIMAVSDTLVNIGLVYQGQLKYDESLEVHLRALKMREANGDSAKIAVSFSNLGNIYKALGQNDMALNYYQQALSLSEKVNDKRVMLQSYNNLGELYFELKKSTEAHRYLALAVKLAEETGLKNQLRKAYEFLSMLYAQEEDYKQAYKHQLLYAKLDREISNSEVSVQMAQMSLRHEMEQNERAAEIEKSKNAELQKANELLAVYVHRLEVSNDELNQFAHVASHDLREPLRMISSYLGLLEKGLSEKTTDMQKQFFSFAIDGAKRMEILIYDLLQLAKVDADPKIETVSLQKVAEEIKNNLEILLREKNGRILANGLPDIMADKTQMLQLFQNIIGNGIKYNESEQPTILISHLIANSELTLTISDNGIGIPYDYRESAFQIFKRVPTTRKYEGSGIGLAICKKIVEGMNGSITIGENQDGGTLFTIKMPL
jgi:signal transduction histidine kinase